MPQEYPDGPAVERVVAYVELDVELVTDADKRAKLQRIREGEGSYGMTATFTAELRDGRRVTAGGHGFGGPRHGIGAIWHRYRGPQLSDDPAEHERLLRETYHVGLSDIEDAINQALGRDPDQHRPPRLSWGPLQDALARAGIEMTEEELIALPLNIELSDQVQTEIAQGDSTTLPR
jgi:hypothetical protein